MDAGGSALAHVGKEASARGWTALSVFVHSGRLPLDWETLATT